MADDTRSSREEFGEARRALVDMFVAQNPGLTHTDFNDVKIADFADHAKTVVGQRANADLEAAARALGKSVDEVKAMRDGSQQGESTPQSRTANLPQGKAAPTLPQFGAQAGTPGQTTDGPEVWGTDKIEVQAAEDIAIWKSTGRWPRRANNDMPFEQ